MIVMVYMLYMLLLVLLLINCLIKPAPLLQRIRIRILTRHPDHPDVMIKYEILKAHSMYDCTDCGDDDVCWWLMVMTWR